MTTADDMWKEIEAMPHPRPPERPTTPIQAFTRAFLGLPQNGSPTAPTNGQEANQVSHPHPTPAPQPPANVDKLLDPVAFNHDAELMFRDLVNRLLAEGPQPTGYVIGYIAFELDISPATVKRYLIKYTTHPRAPFAIRNGTVTRRDTP